jgi:hypothetical protein
VESTESSNRIEGIVAAPGRVRDLVVHHTQPRDRSEQEIAGYRDALQLIHQSDADMRFTENVILQLHQMRYRYQPVLVGAGRARITTSSSEMATATWCASASRPHARWPPRRQ